MRVDIDNGEHTHSMPPLPFDSLNTTDTTEFTDFSTYDSPSDYSSGLTLPASASEAVDLLQSPATDVAGEKPRISCHHHKRRPALGDRSSPAPRRRAASNSAPCA